MKTYAVLLAVAAYACSPANSDDKRSRLAALKAEREKITVEIQTLESELAGEGTPSRAVRMKEVKTEKSFAGPFEHYIKTQGVVEATNNILLSAQASGITTAVYVKEGQQVARGEVLAQIDNSVLLQNIESIKTQVVLAETIYQRQEKLWSQKIGTEIQFLQAKTNLEAMEKQLASLQAQNELTRIKSPISGSIDEVILKIGENTAPGMPAIRVVNSADLKFVLAISEAYGNEIRRGNKAVVTISDLKVDLVSEVTFTGKMIDPLTRTFVAEIKLPTRPDLKPNMTGVAKVVFRTDDAAITVPVNVVQELNGEKVVFIAEKNGDMTLARKRTVTVQGVFDNRAQVTGLQSGDRIIVSGYQGLNDGDYVND